TTPNLFLNGHPYFVQREWSNAPGSCALSLCGSSVCAPAVTVSKTATQCVPGSGGETIDYTFQYSNPSDVDVANDASLSDTFPAGVQWTSGTPPSSTNGNVLTFDLGDIVVHGGGTIHFFATLNSPPPPDTLLLNSAALSFGDSLFEAQTPATGKA